MMALRAEIHSHPSVLDTLADEWTALLRQASTDVPFLTPSYQRAWWRHLGGGTLCLVTVRDKAELVGIVPLFLSRSPEGLTLQWVGCVEVSDYLDGVIAAGREKEVWETVLDALTGPSAPPWARMDLCSIPASSPTREVLPALARERGWVAETEVQEVCPVVLLPSTWEKYLASLDRKDRHELRRKLRRAEALEGLRWYIVGPEHNLEAEAEDFLTLMAKSTRAKEQFLTPSMRAFFRELMRSAFAEGWLQLAFLEWDGRKLAAYLNLAYRDRVMVYNSGLDWQADPGLGAGIVLSAFLIRHAIAEGREAYDFLRGSEDYKYRLGGKDVPVYRVVVLQREKTVGMRYALWSAVSAGRRPRKADFPSAVRASAEISESPMERILEGHFSPEDRDRNEFPLIPFEVPPGVARLSVAYEFSRPLSADKAGWEEGNILDIGLFDPRGVEFPGGRGFRGWSGSARRGFTLSATDATPGYLPGPILPGTWHILLGLYQLAPEGCDYRIVVRMELGGADDAPFPLPCPCDPAPLAPGPRWFRGDLHTHSHHSDGAAPLEDLFAAARAQGLDFLAVTEHNTVSHLPGLCRRLPVGAGLAPASNGRPLRLPLLIPGVEISTYHGHANLWPVADWADFRCQRDDQMRQVREWAREHGALFSVNHPKDDGPPWMFGDFFDPDCMEVWGAPWFLSNYQALAVWDSLLRAGHRITAVGGSDKHQGPFTGELGWYEVGTPTTWVWAEELSIPAIMAGLRAGHVFISEGPAGPKVELTAGTAGRWAMMGDTLSLPPGATLRLTCRVQGAAGCRLRLVSAWRVLQTEIPADDFTYTWGILPEDDRYFRPEVIDPPEVPLEEEPAALTMRAMGNPVYLQ